MRDKVRLNLLGLVFVFVIGCVSQQQKDFEFVQNRVDQLRGLEKWPATVCEIEALPTPSALARYVQLNPAEARRLKPEVWSFKWRQTESRCEIASSSKLKAVEMQKGIVQAAMCLPLQVFFINSPFDEVRIAASSVSREERLIHIGDKPGSHLGYYLDTTNTTVLTRTQSKGELSAHYADAGGEWLPDSIEQNTEALKILLDGFNYSSMRIKDRRMLESLWISVGTDTARRHSQILVKNCAPM